MHFAAAVAADEPPLQVVKPGEGRSRPTGSLHAGRLKPNSLVVASVRIEP